MDIGDWLRGLGLAQYEAVFRDNGVDVDILPALSDADLEKLGVLLGHRRRIQRRIASLGASPTSEPTAKAPAQPAATETAERRHLTVMFCDLVNSTSISAKLDAEDWRDLVGTYLDAAGAAVTRMGGHVAKKLGDGIMALFGYPLAQENDAERALRASLDIIRALAEINAASAGRPKLEARLGVETGAVVVDSQGEIFGDAPNVASRVQAAAEPGTVWTTDRVRRQVAGLFVAEDRGPHQLKGVPASTNLFRIVRASGGGRRSGQRALSPLVGRQEELTLLMRRWQRARGGEGQFIQIIAEPGLGKSRLIEEFRTRLVDEPHTWVEWASSQLLQNTPLHPIYDWGRQRFGGADVPVERRLVELETALAAVNLDVGEHVPLLAPLLDMPLPEDRASKLPPEELRRRQMAALLAWVTAGAKTQPLVLAFEDLHWADPTTLDLLKGLAERGALAPLFVVASGRPEFRAPWGARSHHGTITLTPLDGAQVAIMVTELASQHALSKDTIEGVTERTGGVPLFVEEVTRLLLERGPQGGAHVIPPTLAQSLTARLDRLGAAREVAMIGAVLGRGFSYALLAAVAAVAPEGAGPGRPGLHEAGYQSDETALQRSLEKLAEADILLVEGLPPASEYRFKHSLIQDAAYENLLKSRRHALHRRAAETLRDQFPALAEAQPEVLARHFTEAGLTEEAIEYWGKAGDTALRRSAFPEAIAHLGKAIEMADKTAAPPNKTATAAPATVDRRLRLQTSYGLAMQWWKGFAAEETKAALAQTQQLAAESGNVAERMKAYYARWTTELMGGEINLAHQVAEGFLHDAKSSGGGPSAVRAGASLGLTYLLQGQLALAREHLYEALRVYNPGWEASARRLYGIECGITAKVYLSYLTWYVGDPSGAAAQFDEASTDALSSEHAPTIANCFWFKAQQEMLRGDAAATMRAAEILLDVAEKNGLELYENLARVHLRWARTRLVAVDPLESLRSDAGIYIEQRGRLAAPLFRGRLAELEAELESPAVALTSIDRAIEQARDGDVRYVDSLLHCIRGEILLKACPENCVPAEQAYLAAIAVAREQGARSFGLQAALKLAKLYQSIHRRLEAHDILSIALEGFAPTPEMQEIAEAQALLAELAQGGALGIAQDEERPAERHSRNHVQTRA